MEGLLNVSGTSSHINASRVTGDMAMKTTYGNINVGKAAGKLSAVALSGNISVEHLKGALHTESSYGNMNFTDISGPVFSRGKSTNFKIHMAEGDITITNTYGNVSLKATSGNIDIVNSSGNIEGADVFLTDKMRVALTYGDMKIKLSNEPAEISYDLTAHTGDLAIKRLNITGKKNLRYGEGPVSISATTSSGNLYFE